VEQAVAVRSGRRGGARRPTGRRRARGHDSWARRRRPRPRATKASRRRIDDDSLLQGWIEVSQRRIEAPGGGSTTTASSMASQQIQRPRRPRCGSGLLFVHGRGSGRSALPGRRSGEVVLPGRGSGEDDLSGNGYGEEETPVADPARCGGAGIGLGTGSSVGSRMGSPTGSWFFLFFLTINRGGHPKKPAAGNRLTAAGKAARRG